MTFSLIICTYLRPQPLLKLLQSIKSQSLYPDEILIIDGSANNETRDILEQNQFDNLQYFLVASENRGLTRQRNFGISKVGSDIKIVCFLDDDTVLDKDYFENIVDVYQTLPDAIGVGGVSTNDNSWQVNIENKKTNSKYFVLDGYFIKESSRNYFRNLFGLSSKNLPGIMPKFSHGRTFSYPLNNKVYQVDLLIGMSMSFRKIVFKNINFSEYFEGYGLYEDADFSIRALQFGNNYISTAAKLKHFHDASGRPNQFSYGKMVVRNGWYVWRVKNPNPDFNTKLKWHSITILLTIIRFINTFTTTKKKAAFTEAIGRTVGWWSLIFNKPKAISM